ncbi:MORC family CW-type zinc finger protein 3a isoform X2 [Pseudoliparis swirei]|uniref:MORC family CW-type zinc finger protein 3a isoform X2 n=1 Tax=Pseudoliparis swirei TaxID=2059687 RepID=UPI0024BE5A4B|nr:MORC family CW-type zinc finger protein 3a isoform X2 [Pseudoliparis swirei]
MATVRGVPLSTLSPKFLHTNSTSHTWPFSAIAELIDNAYDPDVSAKQFWIDKTMVHGHACLSFMDNGNGLDHEMMHKMLSVREEQRASLQDILSYSPFKTQRELLLEVDAICSNSSTKKTGTRIIIWNLRGTSTSSTEFDFDTDRYDIRIPADVYEEMNSTQYPDRAASNIPVSFYSLRAYCSILYLKPRMQIMIRGQNVKSQLIAKSLASIRKDHYRPNFVEKRIPIIFGYNTKSKDQYGIMMYYKNRLIKAYERVGCQLKANNKGVGVIGIIECHFLEPTHNKQSFDETDKYRKTMTNLGTKLEEYWNEMCFRRKRENPNATTPVEDTMKRPDQNWVQCNDCLHWRKLPDGIDCNKLPDQWYCRMNPDPQFRSCLVEEEPEDSDDEQPTYCKTYKQQEREDKRTQEMERQRAEDDRRRQQEQQKAERNRVQRRLQNAHPPATPTAPKRLTSLRPQSSAPHFRALPLSQVVCGSSSSNNGLPVISSVCSLSTEPREKRTQPAAPQPLPKRLKFNGNSDTPTLLDVSPQSSPSVLVNNEEDTDDTDDTDDDIFILETASTPKPKNPTCDLTQVKTEREQSGADVGMLLEFSDDDAVDGAATGPVGTGSSPAPPQLVANSTTQTEGPKVKEEKKDRVLPTEGEARAGQSTSTSNGSVGTDAQIIVKHENSGDTRGNQTLQNGGMHHRGPPRANACDETDSSRHYPSAAEVQDQQDQQDQLLDLMQATAVERDSFREQVHKLTCQQQDMESRLQAQVNVKREGWHQASQTEDTKDYKALFERAKEKVDALIKDKELLLTSTEATPSAAQCEEKDMDDIALQVDRLMREMEEVKKERGELHTRLDGLEEEKANLASECEELRLSLQQEREKAQRGSTRPHRDADSTDPTDPEEAAATTSNPDTNSSADTPRSLIELRHNVGRLLVSFVPCLDLGQVNYECDVIDEILEHVLSDVESIRRAGQLYRK